MRGVVWGGGRREDLQYTKKVRKYFKGFKAVIPRHPGSKHQILHITKINPEKEKFTLCAGVNMPTKAEFLFWEAILGISFYSERPFLA